MKKQILTALIVLGTMLSVTAQINIPDANFKAFLLADTIINPNKDGNITMAEAANFTGKMDCNLKNIADMTGIEHFVNMTELDCSKNTQMTSITLPTSDSLQVLHITNNSLTTLDISNCPNMKWLYAKKCDLTSINLGTAAKLEVLDLNANEFTSLDISNLPSLTNFTLYKNSSKLDSIRVVNNPKMTSLVVREVGISHIEASNLPKLKGYYLIETELNRSFYLSSFPDLEYLWITDSATIDTVNLSNLTSLKDVYLTNIKMKVLITKGANIRRLNIWNNELTALDLSETSVSNIAASQNKLSGILDISNNGSLNSLVVSFNNITGLILASDGGYLNEINAGNNDFTILDLSKTKYLKSIKLDGCKNLESLNLKNGNNKNVEISGSIPQIYLFSCPKLRCVQVDDSAFSNKNWRGWLIDSTAYYSENCGGNVSVADMALTHIASYPNPTSGILHIATDQPIKQVQVTNSTGQKVMSINQNTHQIDVTILSSGIYWLLILGDEGVSYSKFTKL